MLGVEIEPKWNVKLYRVSMSEGKYQVEIEPKWNVKTTMSISSGSVHCRNRTKVEC